MISRADKQLPLKASNLFGYNPSTAARGKRFRAWIQTNCRYNLLFRMAVIHDYLRIFIRSVTNDCTFLLSCKGIDFSFVSFVCIPSRGPVEG